ncbi:uncharacterized protein G2W53_027067 [Senna tora]|uniref:Uncharacterized protein n=1 Tax=Senna tora TaxID=362788 RepID=A0A834TI14_9FABA|nr:uncharacterized protein G2W53_027067 [Senna tora]
MDDDVDRRRSTTLKNESSMGQLFIYAKSHVHILRQNDPYNTRKPPKKFQAYETRKPPKEFQRNPTCARPNVRWTTTWIVVDKMIPMTQGSLPRSFKAIRVGCPAVDHVDRRPSKINESLGHKETSQEVSWQSDLRTAKSLMDDDVDRRRSATLINQPPVGQLFFYAKSHVHMLGQNEAYETRKAPKKFQGNPNCACPNLRWMTTWIAVDRRRSIVNHPWAIRVCRRAVDHVDRRPSKINESWLNFFSMENLWCIRWVKMKPMTQGNLQEVSRQSDLRVSKSSMDDDVDRRRSATGKNQSPMGQLFFYAKSQVHLLGQNESYDTRKPPKKFQGNP